ncbi:5'-methylthioadenosine/S-adenosylhomocysteine nucleosidase [Prevotella sp. E9-3]|uniref:5'-methylthioadenosine/S-adenosylhomocysteine nucleosidase n=1 Tax=Prevotella sp. E9-3 TaxID=2913621 RepID=UPI001EDA28D0|nr:5'-methylthioadenosine/S-adenosylhomocysteine nucleosidase [Prevotella sp. E9-3]UKK48132.1 5'-methylthioadenosine/S-adenosylhomocysteine nucleosidase [Prevotella sp. E9-3]
MRIGIIVAMDKELRQLQEVFKNSDVLVQKCGIGKVNAALGAQRMINEFHPDCIISSGCAGGNGDDVNIQDVIVSSELCYHDVYCGTAIDENTIYGQVQGLPARYQADSYLLQKSLECREILSSPDKSCGAELNSTLHTGLIVTGDWFVDSKEKMRDIIGHFPEAKAVDMESCAIAQTCYINKVPFISFRIISDLPLKDTDASQYHNFWDNVAERSFQITKTFVEKL